MPQIAYASSITTTTSFIVSSDESLNKRPPSSSRSSSHSSSDNMAAAAASDSIQNNHHHPHSQSYFVTAASLNPAHNLAFNQSSESSVSSSSYSSSSTPNQPVANCQVNLATPTSATQQMNITSTTQCISSNAQQQQRQQQQSSQRFGSAPNQLSVNSLNDQYGNFTDMQQQVTTNGLQFVDEPLNDNLSRPNGLLNAGSQGQHSANYASYTHQNIINSTSSNSPAVAGVVKSSFQQHSPNNQRSSLNSSLDSSSTSNSLMPINVKGMILNGVASDEVLRSWLISIKCDEYLRNFLDHGYDMHLLTRMTPQDLTAIGCRSPNLRKKLLMEIRKLNLDDDIPNDFRPNDLAHWLAQLKLSEYQGQLCREGYDSVEKVCQLTWEDLEEIGIIRLGHQKRLLLGIERLQKQDKQNEDLHRDHAIYDVHPNHRISLHPGMSDKRLSRSTVRSGFFTTKSGNLDNRGVPVATVMPALKHVSNSLAKLDLSQQTITNVECLNGHNQIIYSIENDRINSTQRKSPQTIGSQNHPSHHEQQTMKMSDFNGMGTMKRPPPLPPVRTNSLKITTTDQQIDGNNIYDNTEGAYQSNNTTMGYNTITSSSTSFLRTPKLGTLTATTNKMLSHGGHIQTISTQVPVTKPVPIREAPHPPQAPPLPPPPPPPSRPPGSQSMNGLTEKMVEQQPHLGLSIDPLMDSSQVGHQIASADEFPPPPPPQ